MTLVHNKHKVVLSELKFEIKGTKDNFHEGQEIICPLIGSTL